MSLFRLVAKLLSSKVNEEVGYAWDPDDEDVPTYAQVLGTYDVETFGSPCGIPAECPVCVLPGWFANDGYAEVEYPEAKSGREAAEAYVEGGNWGETHTAFAITVRAWRRGYTLDVDGELLELQLDEDTHTIVVQPDEPGCRQSDAHDWQSPHEVVGGLEEDPGVFGSGGGVITTEVCAHCRWYRVTNTWDQSLDGQPRETISYREPDEYSLEWGAGR